MIQIKQQNGLSRKILYALVLAFVCGLNATAQNDRAGYWNEESRIRPGYQEYTWAIEHEQEKEGSWEMDTIALLRLFYDATIDQNKTVNSRFKGKTVEIMPQNGNARKEDLATCSWYIRQDLYDKGVRFKAVDDMAMPHGGFSSDKSSDFKWKNLCDTKDGGISINVENPYRRSIEVWLSIELPFINNETQTTVYNPMGIDSTLSDLEEIAFASIPVPYDDGAPAYSTSENNPSRYDRNVPNIYYTNNKDRYNRTTDKGFPNFKRGLLSKSYDDLLTAGDKTYLINPVWEEFKTDDGTPQANRYVADALDWNGERTSDRVVEAVWNPTAKRYELNIDLGLNIHRAAGQVEGIKNTVQAIVRGEKGHVIGMGHRIFVPYNCELGRTDANAGEWKVFRDFVAFRAVGMDDDSRGTVDKFGNVEFLNPHPNGGWIKAEYSPFAQSDFLNYDCNFFDMIIGGDEIQTKGFLADDFPNGQDAGSKGFRYPGGDLLFPVYENNTANFLVLFSDAKFQVSDVILLERDKYVTSASGEMYTNYKWQDYSKNTANGKEMTAMQARENTRRHTPGQYYAGELFEKFKDSATDCMDKNAYSFVDRGSNLNQVVYVNKTSTPGGIAGRTKPYNIVVAELDQDNNPANGECDALYLTDRGVLNCTFGKYQGKFTWIDKKTKKRKETTVGSIYPIYGYAGTFREYKDPQDENNVETYRASGYEFGAPYAFKAKRVLFDRNFAAGRRATVYLPFDMTAEDLSKLNASEALRFDRVEETKAVFTHTDAMPGNTGYLITPTKDVVTHRHGEQSPEVTPVDFGSKDILATNPDGPTGATEPCFQGTYKFLHLDPVSDSYNTQHYFFNWSTGLFNKPNSQRGANFKAFRAAIAVPGGSGTNAQQLALTIDDSQTTGIVTAGDDAATAGKSPVYSIDGRCVSTDGNTEGLPSGVYIVNGKKIVL